MITRRAWWPLAAAGVAALRWQPAHAGARGYMQVMPFWTRLIGDGDAGKLFHMQTNLRFGCVILRHYIDRERRRG